MKYKLLLACLLSLSGEAQDLLKLSQDYLSAVRYGDAVESYHDKLAHLAEETLAQSLDTDRKKKVFWINLYNAAVQSALKSDSLQYQRRYKFYGTERLVVAGRRLSLNDIEHGILRRSQWVYGLGKVPKLFPSSFEKRHRVEELDLRIHFALNCGAKSCPPILFYTLDDFEKQIDEATKGFLLENTEIRGETLILSKLFFYYSGDFGSQQDKRDFVKSYVDLVGLDKTTKIEYADYDWRLQLDMYR